MTSSQALWALFAIVLVQAVTGLAVVVLGRQQAVLSRVLPFLVSGAAGVLLATACLDLLPEAVAANHGQHVTWTALLISLLCLFCLEAVARGVEERGNPASNATAGGVIGHDHADESGEPHGHHHHRRGGAGSASLLVGSALHSVVDGLAIAAAVSAGSRPGWSAAVAVTLHELPHRLGDFSLFLHKGMSRRRAAQLAIGAGGASLAGGVAVLLLGRRAQAPQWLLPVSAASFFYIALADLLPELQARREGRRLVWEIVCLLAGALVIAGTLHISGE